MSSSRSFYYASRATQLLLREFLYKFRTFVFHCFIFLFHICGCFSCKLLFYIYERDVCAYIYIYILRSLTKRPDGCCFFFLSSWEFRAALRMLTKISKRTLFCFFARHNRRENTCETYLELCISGIMTLPYCCTRRAMCVCVCVRLPPFSFSRTLPRHALYARCRQSVVPYS